MSVPPLVQAMAEFHAKLHPGPSPGEQPSFHDLLTLRRKIIKRLTARNLRDVNMHEVWSKLALRPRVKEAYVDDNWRRWNATLKASDETALKGEKAAALLFAMTVNVFSGRWQVWIRRDIEERTELLRVVAEQCMVAARQRRMEAENYPWLRQLAAADADALLRAGDHFEKQFDFNVKFDPAVVDKRGPRDQVRTRVVALVTEMKNLYGKPLLGETAALAKAALNDPDIDQDQVHRWWNRRSVPSKPSHKGHSEK
jgi:hypothetical protein